MALTVGTTAGLVAIVALIYWIVARIGKDRSDDTPSWPQRASSVSPAAAGPEHSQFIPAPRAISFGKRVR